MITKYKITCLKCKSSREINIIEQNGRYLIDWIETPSNQQAKKAKIISGRRRLDNKWGWSCVCGNDDTLTEQEKRIITNKQEPDPQEIAEVVRSLKPEKPKFKMVKI